jgi:hypothetical protein
MELSSALGLGLHIVGLGDPLLDELDLGLDVPGPELLGGSFRFLRESLVFAFNRPARAISNTVVTVSSTPFAFSPSGR